MLAACSDVANEETLFSATGVGHSPRATAASSTTPPRSAPTAAPEGESKERKAGKSCSFILLCFVKLSLNEPLQNKVIWLANS